MLGIALVTLVVSVDACQPFSVRVSVTFGCSSNPEQHCGTSCPISWVPPGRFPRGCLGSLWRRSQIPRPVAKFRGSSFSFQSRVSSEGWWGNDGWSDDWRWM